MQLEFSSIDLSKQHAYLEALSQSPQVTSDYSFINLWGWMTVYGLEWAWSENLVWIRQNLPRPMNWAPVGDWKHADWTRIVKPSPESGAGFVRVPEPLVEIWKNFFGQSMTATEDRDQWDYVYDSKELIELPGNRFHKKKNHLNQFKKAYACQYAPITHNIVEQAKAMQNDWCTWRECSSDIELAHENEAIARVLAAWDDLSGVMGGCILVDGRAAAYTVGERLTPDMMVIHFEKGSAEYKGVYQAINQMFLEHQAAGIPWVNREQDIGDEGLRQAKLSYHPVRFLKKFRVVF
ncbi:MAG: phosphatidylglycerol lysyltransferase domain-containing protein [Desulfobacterales bacterium]|jgi:hypothetical protein|nr:phosphatidylglycerol lysyltransferase domain-containing protein [Desulfobacterales bacterium]